MAVGPKHTVLVVCLIAGILIAGCPGLKPKAPVDRVVGIMNGDAVDESTTHWAIDAIGEDLGRVSFLADGTGRFQAGEDGPIQEFAWTQTANDALAVEPALAFASLSDILGNVSTSSFVARFEDGSLHSFTLREGPLTAGNAPRLDGGWIFASDGESSIRRFKLSTLEEDAPLNGGLTQLNRAYGVAADTVNGKLYISNNGDASITVYPLDASGNTAPIARIAGPSTGLRAYAGQELWRPGALYVDVVHGELASFNYNPPIPYGASNSSITFYALDADGDVAPLRTIQGPATLLDYPADIEVDLVHDEIFVSEVKRVGVQCPDCPYYEPRTEFLVFNRSASGNVAPLRTTSSNEIRGLQLGLSPDQGEFLATGPEIRVRAMATGAFVRSVQPGAAILDVAASSDLVVTREYGELQVRNLALEVQGTIAVTGALVFIDVVPA